MRLHRLTMRAFGPFAGVETIDFDELCEAGLFLLTGPTGAGKTTILDAVCFALYGSVPGARGVKALKSQHAADDASPEVELDFSVRDRRFVVRRTPEWTRPKRRGTGLVTEKASATLVETRHDEDHLLSSRAQEVGHFIGELVGMQSTQFVQVAMLPQGEFQRFLRASSQDRHDVLQHLFRTNRFARIEEWVHGHSRTLRERATSGQATVQRLLHTIADRSEAELPDQLVEDVWVGDDVPDLAVAWAREILASTQQRCRVAERSRTEAAAASDAARREHEEATLRLRAWERRTAAESALAELDAEATTADTLRQRLDADARASRCGPLLEVLTGADAERGRSAERQAAAVEILATTVSPFYTPSGPPAVADLDVAEQSIRARLTRTESLLPRETALRDAERELDDTEQALDAATHSREEADARRDSLPAELAALSERLAAVGEVAGRADALTTALEAATGRLQAARELSARAIELDELRELHRGVRDRAADARDHVQSLVARRLAGIAAELAGQLADGDPCQVCGSTVHPDPAEVAAGAVTEAEQDEAARAFDTLLAASEGAAREVAEAQRRLDRVTEAAAGRDVGQAVAERDDARGSLEAARAAEAERVALAAAVERLDEELASVTATVHRRDTEIAALTQRAAGHRRTIELATSDLADLIADVAGAPGAAGRRPGRQQDLTSLRGVIDHLDDLLDRLSHAREALVRAELAETRYTEVAQQASATARDQGFATLEDVRRAVLEDPERERAARLLRERAEATARAAGVLEDPEVVALTTEPPPALAPLAATVAGTEAVLAEAARDLHHHEGCATSLVANVARLEDAVASWAPARRSYLQAEEMSRLVRGIGGDNQLQMRLSSYVLATRLDQVVAAANERLAHMRDQRYLLQRTGRVSRKGSQAGLGLEVVDQWTGDVRDPATLSGGETFVVSLALALGLADVVTQEAGGTEIETLFVDEGFGTLDADTLDDVMDRLDDLRAGGRAVGVVSHVSELRNRIPTQLHVDKHRTGSTVSVRTLVG